MVKSIAPIYAKKWTLSSRTHELTKCNISQSLGPLVCKCRHTSSTQTPIQSQTFPFRTLYQTEMHNLCQLFLLVLAASFVSLDVSANNLFPIPSHRALVAPLTKHTNTSLYSITLNSQQHFLINLDAPFTWHICITPHHSVLCAIPPCQQARSYSYANSSCPPSSNNITTKHCEVTLVNPVTRACDISQFTYDYVYINRIDGTNPTSTMNILQVGLSCAPRLLLKSFPQKVTGVLAISVSFISLLPIFTHFSGDS